MKKRLFRLFYLLFLFTFLQQISFAQSSAEIIGKPYKIGSLEIAKHDFKKIGKWGVMKNTAAQLGKGWRLPTLQELKVMYVKKDELRLEGSFYWSSQNFEDGYDRAMGIDFFNGTIDAEYKDFMMYGRAVRTIK